MAKGLKVFGVIAAFLIAAVTLAYAMGETSEKTYTWRYKTTVVVDTPEGDKSGSAVREVINEGNLLFGARIPEAGARINRVKGEAVVIDLGKRGVVFALIENGSYGELFDAFSVSNPSNSVEDFEKLKLGMVVPLPEKNWPTFVTFTDINDPKSVVLVRGWRFDVQEQKQFPVDDFENKFGKGVSLKEITIEVTDEPVTWGLVDTRLPENFKEFEKNWKDLPVELRRRIGKLVGFKQRN